MQDCISDGKCINEGWLAEVFHQALKALAYCHDRNLIHKDLKLENIMLLDEPGNGKKVHCMIIDLGIAECFQPSAASPCTLHESLSRLHWGGTPVTMAPEVWKAALGLSTFGTKCDIYSLGCVLFCMLSRKGEYPVSLRSPDPRLWLDAIEKGPDWSFINHTKAKDLVKQMLTFHEDERPDARECLQHTWFRNVSVQRGLDSPVETPKSSISIPAAVPPVPDGS